MKKNKNLRDWLKRTVNRKKEEEAAKESDVNFYNLIILDESGSMQSVRKQVVSGCNETLQTIRVSAMEHPEQKQYVSIYLFDNDMKRSRYLLCNRPINGVKDIADNDYCPMGMTPLYDAIGTTVTELDRKIGKKGQNLVMVTIITDGYENASREYTGKQVRQLIESCKEKGWLFTFIGANIDACHEAEMLSIKNSLQFEQTEEGTRAMFKKERECREACYKRCSEGSKEARKSLWMKLNEHFFDEA